MSTLNEVVRFKTHFCMVSGQAAPNLLPLLDDSMKPEKVVLLVTEPMQRNADFLEQVIKPRQITVVQHRLNVVDDFDAMQEQLMGLLENEPADEIALNVTGGTKWMAIAAQEVFRMNGSAVFYVNAESDKVLFLGKEQAVHSLSQRIDLKSYIQSYGYEFVENSKPVGLSEPLRELCQRLVARVEEWQTAIGQLNLLAATAESRQTLTLSLKDVVPHKDQHLQVVLNECSSSGLLQEKNGNIIFADAQARSFANGGWLEFYTNSQLNSLKSEGVIQDNAHLNLQIQRSGSSIRNEVDVCFMAKNRLHLIECKTKRMTGKGTDQVATDTVYKLDSISELGGLGTKSMLVSYRPLRDADLKRAKDLRIKVIDAQKLKTLKSEIKEWIRR